MVSGMVVFVIGVVVFVIGFVVFILKEVVGVVLFKIVLRVVVVVVVGFGTSKSILERRNCILKIFQFNVSLACDRIIVTSSLVS